MGRIRVIGKEHIPAPSSRSLLILSNHPTFLEPFLVMMSLAPGFFLAPFRAFPWSVGHRAFYDPWYFWWMRHLRYIPVSPAQERKMNSDSLHKMMSVLSSGYRLILFPEGGRTANQKAHHKSSSGKRLGVLRPGAALLALRTNPCILPVWIDGTENVFPRGLYVPRIWRRITIRIGEPFSVEEIYRDLRTQPTYESVSQILAARILGLSEQK